MEMERVPSAGYKIIGLPISGFDRKNLAANIKVVIRLIKSLWKARKIVREFRPDVAVGVGGYASGAALRAANWAGVPTLLQEQNSYAGVTNKLLAQKAARICVAYEGMERFFPAEKIILTGNPVRQNLTEKVNRDEAYSFFGFDAKKRTIVIMGGSLGARTINQSVIAKLKEISEEEDIQLLWQTGKYYIENAQKKRSRTYPTDSSSLHSLPAWTMRMPSLTWLSHVPERVRFPSYVCWGKHRYSSHPPTWRKTIRQRMPWPYHRVTPPS